MIGSWNNILKKGEWHTQKTARQPDYHTLPPLRPRPRLGQIPVPEILRKTHDLKRLPALQDFPAVARPVKPNGQRAATRPKKIALFSLKRTIVKERAILKITRAENFPEPYQNSQRKEVVKKTRQL